MSLVIVDSDIRVNKKYYTEALLEKCKYIINKNKMENLINDDLDLSSSCNKSVNECDNEGDSEPNSDSNE